MITRVLRSFLRKRDKDYLWELCRGLESHGQREGCTCIRANSKSETDASCSRAQTDQNGRQRNGCLEPGCRFFGDVKVSWFRTARWRVAAYHFHVGAGARHGLVITRAPPAAASSARSATPRRTQNTETLDHLMPGQGVCCHRVLHAVAWSLGGLLTCLLTINMEKSGTLSAP